MNNNELELENGKYTIVGIETGGLKALRHGEEWLSLIGDKLVLVMAQEIQELRERLYGDPETSVEENFWDDRTTTDAYSQQDSERDIEARRQIAEKAWDHGFDSAEYQDSGFLNASGWVRNNPFRLEKK